MTHHPQCTTMHTVDGDALLPPLSLCFYLPARHSKAPTFRVASCAAAFNRQCMYACHWSPLSAQKILCDAPILLPRSCSGCLSTKGQQTPSVGGRFCTAWAQR